MVPRSSAAYGMEIEGEKSAFEKFPHYEVS
jgi:hypothetical protein